MKHAKEMHEKAMAIKSKREVFRRAHIASLLETDLMEKIEDATSNGLTYVKYGLNITQQDAEWAIEYLSSFGYSAELISVGICCYIGVSWE